MTYDQFFKDVKAGAIAPVYLFYGTERFVRDSAVDALRARLLPSGFEALNQNVFEGAFTAQAVIEAAETLPMMCDKRLVVVKDWGLLRAGKARDEAAEAELMGGWLARVPDTCCLLFLLDDAPDSRKKLVKQLTAQAAVVEFEPLSDQKIASWCNQQLRPLGKRMDPDAAQQLIFFAGRMLTGLKTEVEKLSAYSGDRALITREDVEAVVTPSGEYTVFQMIDALLSGDAVRAQSLLKALLEGGETRIGALYMITRQLRMLTHIRLMRGQGIPLPEIERKLSLNHYAATRAATQAARFEPEALTEGYRACVEADYSIKSGAMRDAAALDLLMLRLSAQRRSGASRQI